MSERSTDKDDFIHGDMSSNAIRLRAEAHSRRVCDENDALDWEEVHESIENDYYEKKIPALHKKYVKYLEKYTKLKKTFELYRHTYKAEDMKKLLTDVETLKEWKKKKERENNKKERSIAKKRGKNYRA